MKVLGLILIFISSASVGFIKSNTYKERDLELLSLIELLYFIKHEISTYLTLQWEIYEKFDNSVLEKNGFLSILREYSRQGKEKPLLYAIEASQLKLDKEEEEIVKSFARDFGTLSTSDECNRCDRAIRKLEEIYKTKKEETLEKSRLCRSVGCMIGIGLALLMW